MKLGIDFGTTRIVVAAVDRGNYPIVTFDAPEGATTDWFPPLVAIRGHERQFGWNAWTLQAEPNWTIVRSLKRFLEDSGPETRLEVAGRMFHLQTLLVDLVRELAAALRERSSLTIEPDEPLEVVLGVPANANSNQRFLTVEAFRHAGFEVLGLLNEPSAASLEFGHGNKSVNGRLLVYDLGGGTFDVSLVEVDDRTHSVLASEGISTLGGDDFDHVLADLSLEAAGIPEQQQLSLNQSELFRLHEECRQKKESLHPNTRKLTIDLGNVRDGWGQAAVPVADYYEHCRPLMEETLHAVEDLLAAHESEGTLEALYVTGGGSELPLVSRVLREQFGRKVRRSTYTRSATAIGLAIQADAQAGYLLREMFTRYFGVWREGEGGRSIIFDPLYPRGTRLPGPGEPPLVIRRRYSPVHNVGHFRYLECSHLRDGMQPAGYIAVWDEIRFPFDPEVAKENHLASVPVEHSLRAMTQQIEEQFLCDAGGTVSVTISNLTAGYSRDYRLGRWSAKAATVTPGKRKRARK